VDLILSSHPSAGFELPLPASWIQIEAPNDLPLPDLDPDARDAEIALVAVQPDGGQPLPAVLVVASEPIAATTQLDPWVDTNLDELRRSVNRLFVVDAEPVQVDGLPGWRTLTQYAVEDIGAVTLERWLLLAGRRGWTISAVTGTLEYPEIAEATSAAVAGFRLVAHGAP